MTSEFYFSPEKEIDTYRKERPYLKAANLTAKINQSIKEKILRLYGAAFYYIISVINEEVANNGVYSFDDDDLTVLAAICSTTSENILKFLAMLAINNYILWTKTAAGRYLLTIKIINDCYAINYDKRSNIFGKTGNQYAKKEFLHCGYCRDYEKCKAKGTICDSGKCEKYRTADDKDKQAENIKDYETTHGTVVDDNEFIDNYTFDINEILSNISNKMNINSDDESRVKNELLANGYSSNFLVAIFRHASTTNILLASKQALKKRLTGDAYSRYVWTTATKIYGFKTIGSKGQPNADAGASNTNSDAMPYTAQPMTRKTKYDIILDSIPPEIIQHGGGKNDFKRYWADISAGDDTQRHYIISNGIQSYLNYNEQPDFYTATKTMPQDWLNGTALKSQEKLEAAGRYADNKTNENFQKLLNDWKQKTDHAGGKR